jgi:hypothetical protein
MRKIRLLVAALLVIVGVSGIARLAEAAPPVAAGTITLNETGPFTIDDVVTFTTTTDNIKGSQWPMVYVECRSTIDNTVLYGQLDHPDVGFLLGGGSSPWREPDNAGEDAVCVAGLYTYSKQGDIALLAQTSPFAAAG